MLAYASLVLSLALSAAASAIPAAPANLRREEYGTPWCKALQATCDKQMANTHDYYDFFEHNACLFGATCPPPWYGPVDGPLPQRRNVQNFLQAVCYDVGGPGTEAPTSDTVKVSLDLLKSISTDGKTITRQNFIDGFYHALDASNGPWPTSVDKVIELWEHIVDWTAVCSGGIPFKNFADYFNWSSYVKSSGNC